MARPPCVARNHAFQNGPDALFSTGKLPVLYLQIAILKSDVLFEQAGHGRGTRGFFFCKLLWNDIFEAKPFGWT
jgi:hypothetical protein